MPEEPSETSPVPGGPSVVILGSRVDRVGMDEALRRIADLLARRRFAQIVTFGSEMAMLARRNAGYRDVVNRADLVVPDTVGVVLAARMLGEPVPERVAGIELMERLCATCARDRIPVFLLGGAPGVAEAAARQLQSRHPGLQIAGTRDGYFPESDAAAVTAQIAAAGARLVFVALGFPRQELWVRRHAADLGAVVCMGVGGALDVISGRLRRAPRVMRSLGLEWLYRLIREPRRAVRQLVLPQFAFLVAGQALRRRLFAGR